MTPQQARVMELAAQGLSNIQIGRELGINEGSVRRLKQRASRHLDPAIQDGMNAVGTGLVPQLVWAKTKDEDGTSFSVLLKPEQTSESLADRIRGALEGMTPAPLVSGPETTLAGLCTVYPLMDMHIGMMAWGRETGDVDYDLDLAAADTRQALGKVMAITPASDTAILVLGGDTLHANDNLAETPKSKHKLDMDGRHFKVLDVAIGIIADMICQLARKHRRLIVRVLRGNHDPESHLVLTFALAERYRDNPTIEIEKNPRDLFMFQWGRSAIFVHHGDKGKPQQMALYLSDVCPFWSETKHRHLFVGHVHKDHALDLGPLRFESLRAFCPPDAYASSMGYGGRRAMQAFTFDMADGLIIRAFDPVSRSES